MDKLIHYRKSVETKLERTAQPGNTVTQVYSNNITLPFTIHLTWDVDSMTMWAVLSPSDITLPFTIHLTWDVDSMTMWAVLSPSATLAQI